MIVTRGDMIEGWFEGNTNWRWLYPNWCLGGFVQNCYSSSDSDNYILSHMILNIDSHEMSNLLINGFFVINFLLISINTLSKIAPSNFLITFFSAFINLLLFPTSLIFSWLGLFSLLALGSFFYIKKKRKEDNFILLIV